MFHKHLVEDEVISIPVFDRRKDLGGIVGLKEAQIRLVAAGA
jgi:hypothetical protein